MTEIVLTLHFNDIDAVTVCRPYKLYREDFTALFTDTISGKAVVATVLNDGATVEVQIRRAVKQDFPLLTVLIPGVMDCGALFTVTAHRHCPPPAGWTVYQGAQRPKSGCRYRNWHKETDVRCTNTILKSYSYCRSDAKCAS